MYEVGTVCVKIAGRDAGKQCVIVEDVKDGFVVVEGATRRRKCNIRHLELMGKEVKVKAGASHAEVMKALGIEEKPVKSRKPAAKPDAHANRGKKAAVKKSKKTPKAVKPKTEKKAKLVAEEAEE